MVSLGDAVHRPKLIDRVFCGDLKKILGVVGPVMLDSGGFTMMMQNRSLSIKDIAAIYKRTSAEFCISLDIPPGYKDRAKTRAKKYEQTRVNLEALLDTLGSRKLVPVVHGVTVKEAELNCAAILDIFPRPKIVCIGGLVPLLRRSAGKFGEIGPAFVFIASLISQVRSYFPKAIIHLLGAGSPVTVTNALRCGADSTDSIAWRRAAGYGTIYLPGTSERFLAPRSRKRANSRKTLDNAEQNLLMQCSCPACSEHETLETRLSDLSCSYLARAAHNAFVILQQAKLARINSANNLQL